MLDVSQDISSILRDIQHKNPTIQKYADYLTDTYTAEEFKFLLVIQALNRIDNQITNAFE